MKPRITAIIWIREAMKAYHVWEVKCGTVTRTVSGFNQACEIARDWNEWEKRRQ